MVSIRLTKRRIVLAIFLLAVLVLSIFAMAYFGGTGNAAAHLAESNNDRIAFLKQYGWEVESAPLEITTVVIPAEFDEVYTPYNEMQQAQGFDLGPFKGKSVTRYCYHISNYPSEQMVVANLLVYNNQIIGGDIDSPALDGFMHGFSTDVQSAITQTWSYGF